MARKILLADDSVTAQNMGRKILADAGYEVITVNNGSAALKKIAEHRPDVIVLDVYMPGYSGLEVCQRLKEVGDTAGIPVLLTVGKLEPFKPEEAKRVRADGFIVKPFEASELLSALTRLEDKIVPRNESTKPGRFGRIAAAEEGRFDKTMSVAEDSGWKNRIAFPTKKKQKEPEPQQEETPAFTTQKDLRSAIERIPVEPSSREKSDEMVNLGALASAGLPKDVTPEEIAALATAAARMKGKLAEEKPTEEMAVIAATEPPQQSEPAAVAIAAVPDLLANSEGGDTNSVISEVSAIAEQKADSSTARVTTASSWQASDSANEPATIAVAAAVGESTSHVSRWTAVSVALAPEDASLSLEQEMQKAYAAFAAAEDGHSAAASMTGSSVAIETAAPEASVSIPATAAPEAVQTLSAVASAATDAVTAAVKELENVANAYAIPSPTSLEISATAPQTEAPEQATEKLEASSLTSASGIENPQASQPDSEQRPVEVKEETAPVEHSASTQAGLEEAAKAEIIAETASVLSATASAESSAEPSAPQEQATSSEASALQGTAAMAATVGGKPVEEAATSFDADPAIASIVDSVLANLRPKIVEEISRKLGRK